jgi:hypothetical protein
VPARSVSGAGGKAECLEIKVTGAREIEKILKELGPTAANRVARSALNRSATRIVRRAKELVPVATSELKRATTRRQRRGSGHCGSNRLTRSRQHPDTRSDFVRGTPQAMSRRAYLLATAIIFSLVALLHLARIVFGWSAVIGAWSVPMWLSWIALVVTGALAYFGFSLAGRSSRSSTFR